MPYMEHDPHHPEDVLKVDMDEQGRGGDDAYDCARYGVMEDAVVNGVYTASPVRLILPFAATNEVPYGGHVGNFTEVEKEVISQAMFTSMMHLDKNGGLVLPERNIDPLKPPPAYGGYDFNWWKRH
jgi:hypothetical protein